MVLVLEGLFAHVTLERTKSYKHVQHQLAVISKIYFKPEIQVAKQLLMPRLRTPRIEDAKLLIGSKFNT